MEIMVSLDAAIMRGPMFKDGSVKVSFRRSFRAHRGPEREGGSPKFEILGGSVSPLNVLPATPLNSSEAATKCSHGPCALVGCHWQWWRWLEAVLESAFGVEISVPQMGNLVTVVASRLDSDLMEAVKELKRLEQQHSLPPPKDKDPNAQPTGPYQLGER